MKRILISGILIGLFITLGTIAAVLYATGYRFELGGNGTGNLKFVEGTGILVATSKPDGSRVLVNQKLTTATNNTINLQPGEYDIEIQKDGYLPWKKTVTIRKSLVTEANALLFPTAPKLEAVTTIGVGNVTMDQSGSLLAYTVSSASAAKNGVYVLNMNSGPLVFLGASGTQIVSDLIANFSQAVLKFSPDGKELLATLPNATYLLTTDGKNQTPQDVTTTLLVVSRDWQTQQAQADKKIMDSLPRALRSVAASNFIGMKVSPEGDRIVYTASRSASLPFVLKNKVPSLNSLPDQRELDTGNVYVYDIEEDKNFKVFDISTLKENEKTSDYFWHEDGRHLIFAYGNQVNVVEYDGGNLTTVYEGAFQNGLVFPWPDGSSIAIVSRLSANVPYNIYRISLQ